METNIKLENKIQCFADIIYYAIPPNQSKYKIFILLSFNNTLHKIVLCNTSIIANENKEAFIIIFNFIKNKYNFKTDRFTIDYSKALILSVK